MKLTIEWHTSDPVEHKICQLEDVISGKANTMISNTHRKVGQVNHCPANLGSHAGDVVYDELPRRNENPVNGPGA